MTEKRFKLHIKWFNPAKTNGEATLTDNGQPILCTERIEDARLLKNLLNELNDEKERWKSMSVATSNENKILWNEVHILMEQGAEPSDAFKKYLESISTEHTKFWQRKLEKAKKDGVIE